jgi:hypothetical protein
MLACTANSQRQPTPARYRRGALLSRCVYVLASAGTRVAFTSTYAYVNGTPRLRTSSSYFTGGTLRWIVLLQLLLLLPVLFVGVAVRAARLCPPQPPAERRQSVCGGVAVTARTRGVAALCGQLRLQFPLAIPAPATMSINSSMLDESEIDSATGVILEALEPRQNDTVQDMIGKINDLITRLGAADSPATDLTPGSEATNSFATDASGGPSGGKGGRGQTRGRSRALVGQQQHDQQQQQQSRRQTDWGAKKTPIELWNQKNKPPPKPKALLLSEAQRNATTERLLAAKAKKDLDGAQAFEALTAEEQEIGQPDTSRTKQQNDKLQGYVPIHKRYQAVIDKAQRKKAQIERAREDQELAPCTFQPNMGQSNKTFQPGQKFRQPMGTVYDRCNEYGQMKQYRAHRRRQFLKKIEEKELTFEPKLNTNTQRILERTAARNPDKAELLTTRVQNRPRTFQVAGDNRDPGHEEETFAPRINARSRKLAREGEVFERLYENAIQSDEAIMGKINVYFDETVNERFDRPAVLKNKVRDGKGAVTNRERTLVQQGVLVPPNKFHENVVQWDESMSFLRATLRLE